MIKKYQNIVDTQKVKSYNKAQTRNEFIEPLFFLAVLNSKLTTFFFANTFDKFQRKTFPQFKVKELATFPIPQASEKKQSEIAKLMIDL